MAMADVLSKGSLLSTCCYHPRTIRNCLNSEYSGLGSYSCRTLKPLVLKPLFSWSTCDFQGKACFVEKKVKYQPKSGKSRRLFINAQGTLRLKKAPKWWDKGLQPNMKKVTGAQDLVDSLLNAGDKLVVVGFFSPGCGGCRALHPKICQLAGMNPQVQFLQVNHEEHKSMCYSLNITVLPFFRFYRGAHGRVGSFSCTIATIKKFKDALAKHSSDSYSLVGPTKGLEEKELMALAANKDLSFTYDTQKPTEPILTTPEEDVLGELAPSSSDRPLPFSLNMSDEKSAGRTLVASEM